MADPWQSRWVDLQDRVRDLSPGRLALFAAIAAWLRDVQPAMPLGAWLGSDAAALMAVDPTAYGTLNATATPDGIRARILAAVPATAAAQLGAIGQHLRDLLASRARGDCPSCGTVGPAVVVLDGGGCCCECDRCGFVCLPDLRTGKGNQSRVRLATSAEVQAGLADSGLLGER